MPVKTIITVSPFLVYSVPFFVYSVPFLAGKVAYKGIVKPSAFYETIQTLNYPCNLEVVL